VSQVNVGVIGAGWWATFAHIPGICKHPEARLHSVQTRRHVERIAKDFHAVHAFTDVSEMLASKDLQAVVISSTPNAHFEQAKAALERGLHVLVEKPMTISAREAQELIELARKRDVNLMISCPWHYTRHGQQARELIRSGALGRVKMIGLLMTNPIQELLRGNNTNVTHGQKAYVQPELGSYSDPRIAGGGQIYCQVSHAAAYVAFLTGSRPGEVFARFDNDGSEVDIYDTINIKMETGELVSIASTGATPLAKRQYEVRVFGSEGILLLELWQGTMEWIGFSGERKLFPPLAESEIYPEAAPVHNLIDVVLGKQPNLSPGTLGMAAMEVIEAACASAKSGQNVIIRQRS
jgi:predicted dehydrogenase